jgi:REP element-mobilizing transposase RayT
LKGYDYRQAGAYFVTICTQDRAPVFGEIVNGVMILNAAGAMVRDVWNEMPRFYPGVSIDTFIVMPNHVHGIIVLSPEGSLHAAAASAATAEMAPHPGQARGPAPTRPGGATGAAPARCPRVGAGSHACPVASNAQTLSSAIAQSRLSGPPAAGGGSLHAAAASAATAEMAPHPGQARGPAPTMSLPDVVHRLKSLTTHRYAVGAELRNGRPFRGRLWQRNYYEHIIRDAASLDRIREYIAANPARWEEDRLHPRSGLIVPRQPASPSRTHDRRHGQLP